MLGRMRRPLWLGTTSLGQAFFFRGGLLCPVVCSSALIGAQESELARALPAEKAGVDLQVRGGERKKIQPVVVVCARPP